MNFTPPTPDIPVFSDDPFGDEILTNPYDFHRRLRDAGPVVFLERYGIYAMGRYEDVYNSLTDWETYVSSRGAGLSDFKKEKPWRPPSIILEADPPDHTVARKALGDAIGPRSIRSLRESFEAEAEAFVDTLMEKKIIDAVTDLAEVYPLTVFPDAVGIRKEGRENLLPYGALAFNAFGPHNHILMSALETAGPVQEWIVGSCERDALSDNGFGATIWSAADRGEITYEQAPLLVRSLLTAGVDTTVYGIANMMYSMVTNPQQWVALHADPGAVKFAFDEALRYESPIQTFFRTSTREKIVSGVKVPADVKILLYLGAANRDTRKWGDDAETFDISRQSSGHVAFGMGIHQCVGQPLARLEVESVIGALARRVKEVIPAGTPIPKLNNSLKGWSSIPLELVPA